MTSDKSRTSCLSCTLLILKMFQRRRDDVIYDFYVTSLIVLFQRKQQIINQGLPQEDRPEKIFTLQVKSSQKPKRCSPIWIIN